MSGAMKNLQSSRRVFAFCLEDPHPTLACFSPFPGGSCHPLRCWYVVISSMGSLCMCLYWGCYHTGTVIDMPVSHIGP